MHHPTEPDQTLLAGFVTAKNLPATLCPQGQGPCLRTIRTWTKKKLIPHVRIGGRVYYEPARVLAALRKYEIKPL